MTDEAPRQAIRARCSCRYFAPDEPDYSATTWNYKAPGAWVAGQGRFKNNYLADGSIPSSADEPFRHELGLDSRNRHMVGREYPEIQQDDAARDH